MAAAQSHAIRVFAVDATGSPQRRGFWEKFDKLVIHGIQGRRCPY
jgi:hypothetical protein